MKNGILFTLSLFLFLSCESENKVDYTALYKQQLLDEYKSFHKEEALVTRHLELIDELKDRSIADSKKDVFVDNRLESMNLAISKRDSSLFYFVSADEKVEQNHLKFQHEVKLKDVRQIIELPFESLPSDFGAHTTGVMRLKNTTQSMLNEIRLNRFIIVYRTLSKTLPRSIGEEFISGVYRGRMLMYSSKSKELVANMDVLATSSLNVTVSSSPNQILEIDFADRINEAYLTTLQTKFLAINLPELSNLSSY